MSVVLTAFAHAQSKVSHCLILAIDAVQRGWMGVCITHALCDYIAAIIPGHFDDHPCEDCIVNDIVLDPIRNRDRPSQINAKHRYTDPSHFVLLSQWGAGLPSEFVRG